MRSTTAAQDTALAANVRGEFVQIEVQNADGTWIDLTNLAGFDWVMRWSVSWGVDQPLPEARVSLARDRSDANRSLAPLRSDSPLNVDDLAAYAPLLDGGRGFRINVAVMAWGASPGPSDWVRLFTGEIDEVEWGQDPVEVIARSAIGVQLADRFIETETFYGSDAGVPMETVIQSILTDWTDDPVSLYTPTFPGFVLSPARPYEAISVLDAINRITALIGWVVRERWDDGTSQFRLTLQDPDRSKTIPDHTLGPEDYWDVETLRIGRNHVRNAIRVTYFDASTGEVDFVTAEDNTSILRYGRKPLLITESSTGPIDTEVEAQAMADAALADLKDPVAEQKVDNRFFWPAQLGDLYTWTANGVHYNVDQDLAVTRVEHHGEAGMCGTRLDVRGTPTGFNTYWRTLGFGGAAPRLAASFEPRIVPIVVGGVAGAHIDIAYDLAAEVTRVHFQFSYTDGTTSTISRNVDLTGSGVYRLQESGGDPQLFLPGWTDIEILCRVNNNSFDPSQVGRQYIFSYPDIFAGGEGVKAALSAGGSAYSDEIIAGPGVTIAQSGGKIEIGATGGGGASALDGLSDVVIASLLDDDALMYDSGTGDWRNRALTAGDVKSGIFGVARGGSGAGTWEAGAILLGNGASAFGTISPSSAGILKSDGVSWSSSVLVAGDIPGLDASKIITGTFDVARIPDLNASKIDAGTFGAGDYTFPGNAVITALKIGEASHSLVSFTAAANFAQPSGYRTMVQQASGGSTQLPPGWTSYGFYQVMARRDSGAGYHGLFFGYSSGRAWVAENTVGTSTPNWHEVLTEDTPSFTAQALTAQSLNLNTALAVSEGGTGETSFTAGALLTGLGGNIGEIDPAAGAGILKSDGISWSASTLVAGDIPGLDTSKIITGTFADARIPSLAASKITSGVFSIARIPSIPVTGLTPGILDSTSWRWRGTDGTEAEPGLAFSSQINTGIRRVSTSIIGFVAAGTDRMRVVTAGAQLLSGSAAAPSLAGLSFTTSGVYWASGVVGLSVSGTSRIRATTSGAAVTGTITATGDVQSSVSDARLKTDIVPIDRPLERLRQLRGLFYRYTDEALERWPELSGQVRAGLLADDVLEALPPAYIRFAGDPEYGNYDEKQVLALAVATILEQDEQLQDLQAEVESLRARRAA